MGGDAALSGQEHHVAQLLAPQVALHLAEGLLGVTQGLEVLLRDTGLHGVGGGQGLAAGAPAGNGAGCQTHG